MSASKTQKKAHADYVSLISDSGGKMTARERISLLVDEDSFIEMRSMQKTRPVLHSFGNGIKAVAGDGVIVGQATIQQRQVFVFSQDFSVLGGSLGLAHAQKISSVMDLALKSGCPIIGILDSGGARIQEGIASLEGYAEIFRKNVEASGVIPQISIVLGPCAGGASYSPALTDFIFLVKNKSTMFITGPKVIESVTGQKTTLEEVGGAFVHAVQSGVGNFVYDDERKCLAEARKLFSYLPQNSSCKQTIIPSDDSHTRLTGKLESLVPANFTKPYDMRKVISEIVDQGKFFEVSALFAPNMLTGFATLASRVIGIVASQTNSLAGCLDLDASDKVARFVRFCDCFNIPLINLVDAPGYLPGVEQEHQGIIRHGAKVLYAYAEATVPKIALILRKAFGGAYIALASKTLGYDITLAWPIAQIAVMGPEQAAEILFAKELHSSKNPQKLLEAKIKEYEEKLLSPEVAAEMGYIDSIISPKETRIQLIKYLNMLRNKEMLKKSKNHGNIPL